MAKRRKPEGIRVGATVKIPAPSDFRKGHAARFVQATIEYINHRGNYATVRYRVPGQKTTLTTSISLCPVTRIGADGKKHCSLAMRGTGRSTKIGGPMSSSMPTPFGLDVVSASAGR